MIVSFGSTPAIARTMRFDMLDVGGVNRARDVHPYAAGKAVNVARAVQTLGEPVLCVGVQGGSTGAQLLSLLSGDSISHRFLEVSAATRVCVTVIDDRAGHATELIEDAPPLTDAEAGSLLAMFESAVHGARIVVLSGSLARGLASDFYARCVHAAELRGVQVLLDASGQALREAIAERPAVVKINSAELAGLAGAARFDSDRERNAFARNVAEKTRGHVIVTSGSGPTIAVDASGAICTVAPVHVDSVVSPIGCGDSFAAGVAVARLRGQALADQLSLGTACALANLRTSHAAHFDQQAVSQWLERVRVE